MASQGRNRISLEELQRPFSGALAEQFPPILSPAQLGELCGIRQKTIYEWIAKGHLDGAFRKRGKHILIWRDRAINILFNGKDW